MRKYSLRNWSTRDFIHRKKKSICLCTFKSAILLHVTRVLMKIFRTRSRDVTDQCQIMFGMLPIEHHVFLRKVRFLLRFKNSDKWICSLFLDNASSEIKLICKKYSANVNNIYTCIRSAAFERDWTVYLLCLVKLFVVFILLPFGE